MYFVRKLSTGTVHVVQSRESRKTLCGRTCVSNMINDLNYGFSFIKDAKEVLNQPKITCKKCLNLMNNSTIM